MGAYEYELASLLQLWLGQFVQEHQLGRVVTETLFRLRPAVDCFAPRAVAPPAGLPRRRRDLTRTAAHTMTGSGSGSNSGFLVCCGWKNRTRITAASRPRPSGTRNNRKKSTEGFPAIVARKTS